MNKARASILVGGFAVGVFLLVGGGSILANGEAFDYCTKSYTGSWGIMPALFGLVLLGALSVIAWFELG